VLDSASRGPGLPAAGSAVAAAPHPRADTAVAPVLSPPLQLASAGFGEDLGQRILWLSGNNLKSADIQLDPPELGPLQITVQAHRDGTTVHFTTHSAQAREAVEATLPRLRELLEGSGAGTVDVNLAHQQQPDQRAGRHEGVGLATGTARAARAEPAAMAVASRVRQGLIDDYA
jgi:flagellar hook-length control protein FliK